MSLNKSYYITIICSFVVLLLPTKAFARTYNPLLKCLANEELSIHHRKLAGPIYQLNQTLINEISRIGNIRLRDKYQDIICNDPFSTPAVGLLKTMLLRDSSEIFIISGSTSSMNIVLKSSVESFMKKVPTLFFNFIAALESESKTPECLNKSIPELRFFYERLHYLNGKYIESVLVENKSKIQRIFNFLKNINSILKSCNKKAKKSNSNRE